ncbi:MAG TPA: XRE family transcriptional regulator [Rhizomicrobium sp.]|nr:XRE family transcriptional regulator [Rhizomicrobium sp.]
MKSAFQGVKQNIFSGTKAASLPPYHFWYMRIHEGLAMSKPKKKNPHVGSTLDSFLKKESIYTEVMLRAMKSMLAWQVAELMKKRRVTKSQMAKRMRTSRAAVDRLLDAGNTSVTLQTLGRAAAALGKELTIGLRDAA